MPINIKTLLFILPIGAFVFWMAGKHTRDIAHHIEFNRWRNAWLTIQSIAFLSPNIWFFYFTLVATCFYFKPQNDKLGQFVLFSFLLSILPPLSIQIPGFGIINYIFTLTYPRVLSLTILLPLFFYIKRTYPKSESSLNSGLDKIIFYFIILISLLSFRDNTFTNGLRFSFLNFIDYFLPYYVASRVIKTNHDFSRVLLAILIALSIAALIGIFETIRNWHLYNHLVQHLLDMKRMRSLDVRGDILRSAATYRSPIVLGYCIMISLGTLFYFRNKIRAKWLYYIVFIGLITGLFFTVSRGPWLGFVFLVIVFILTGKQRFTNLTKLSLVGILSLPIILFSPFGDKFVSLLPFVGEIRADTVDYRQQLLSVSWDVFKQNPLFGSPSYRENPLMEVMIQGEGIVDIVNSYLNIALQFGLIGLVMYISIFFTSIIKTYKTTKANYKNDDMLLLGRILTAILAAISLTIFTVSSIDYIPWYYWTIIGISSAYHRNYYRQIESELNNNHQIS